MLDRLIMFLLHVSYKRNGHNLMYIKGTGKDYPKYLHYTEHEGVRKNMLYFYNE